MAAAYYEAARVLAQLSSRRVSLKTLIHSDDVTQKKKVYALVSETLRYRAVLQEVAQAAGFVAGGAAEARRLTPELVLVLLYDVLVSGRGVQCGGPLKAAVTPHKKRLLAELTKLKVRRRVRNVEELLSDEARASVWMPRWVRVNTLRASVQSVLAQLQREGYRTVDAEAETWEQLKADDGRWVRVDEHVPEIVALPPSTDLHAHPLYVDGTLVLQDKASCFPAAVLGVSPATLHVIDACAAPGNKTSHLVARMSNHGRVSAFDTDLRRLNLLKTLTAKAGATNIVASHGSFLDVKPNDPLYTDVTHILLDPSCSGSGMVARLDGLLEDTENADGATDDSRLQALASFQLQALKHAMTFPAVERVTYSTCSVHEIENESVVEQALQARPDFELVHILPNWHRRGHSTFEHGEHCVRTLPLEDHVIGFFVACFQRKKHVSLKRTADNLEPVDEINATIKSSRKRPAPKIDAQAPPSSIAPQQAGVNGNSDASDALTRQQKKRKQKQKNKKLKQKEKKAVANAGL